jgi:hypothetical protein
MRISAVLKFGRGGTTIIITIPFARITVGVAGSQNVAIYRILTPVYRRQWWRISLKQLLHD